LRKVSSAKKCGKFFLPQNHVRAAENIFHNFFLNFFFTSTTSVSAKLFNFFLSSK
jgi:hypothetical protein